jgi:hypothetical protein
MRVRRLATVILRGALAAVSGVASRDDDARSGEEDSLPSGELPGGNAGELGQLPVADAGESIGGFANGDSPGDPVPERLEVCPPSALIALLFLAPPINTSDPGVPGLPNMVWMFAFPFPLALYFTDPSPSLAINRAAGPRKPRFLGGLIDNDGNTGDGSFLKFVPKNPSFTERGELSVMLGSSITRLTRREECLVPDDKTGGVTKGEARESSDTSS